MFVSRRTSCILLLLLVCVTGLGRFSRRNRSAVLQQRQFSSGGVYFHYWRRSRPHRCGNCRSSVAAKGFEIDGVSRLGSGTLVCTAVAKLVKSLSAKGSGRRPAIASVSFLSGSRNVAPSLPSTAR